MKRRLKLFCGAAIFLFLAGCSSTSSSALLEKNASEEFSGHYTGLKAKIAVSDFELKTSGINTDIGAALKESFTGVLNNTQHFLIVPAPEAELIISIQVNEFVPEGSGGKSGVGGGGSSPGNFMGGLLGPPLAKANMRLALRIIDPATSTAISSRDIYSQATQMPGQKTKNSHGMVFKGVLSVYTGTPMGKVIYDCFNEAAHYTVQNIPVNYYKY